MIRDLHIDVLKVHRIAKVLGCAVIALLHGSSLRLDIGRFDDRPPAIDLGRVKRPQRLRGLLLARRQFDPKLGKALAHALTALPHDLLIAFDGASLEELVLTSMSITDRPRPKIVTVRSALGRHLFAFVWLPRDEVSTGRRIAVEAMLVRKAKAGVIGWTMVLEDGGAALLRYTLDLRSGGVVPDTEALNAQLEQMVRGWQPEVEAALAKRGGGIHHLCLAVADLEHMLAELKARGVRLIDETPRPGAEGKRIAFVHPPFVPYAPALARSGLPLERIVWIDADGTEAQWAAEQSLRSGAVSAVLYWGASHDSTELRRLQLAAEAGNALVFLFRPLSALDQASVASVRLALTPQNGRLRIDLLKARGGRPSCRSMSLQSRWLAAALANLRSSVSVAAS